MIEFDDSTYTIKMPCHHIHEDNENPDKWVSEVKGNYDAPFFEISVLRKKCCHGRDSYGWFSDSKLYVSKGGKALNLSITEFVFNKLIKSAQELADELNEKENIK